MIFGFVARRVCLNHADKLCACSPSHHRLRYRYTLDALLDMITRLKESHADFELWVRRAKQAFDYRDDQRLG
jgi:C5HC2 zinc finger